MGKPSLHSTQKTIAFIPVQAGQYTTYLGRGAASDVWLVSQGPSGSAPMYVSKMLRVTSKNFDHWTTTYAEDDTSDNMTWLDFVKNYKSRVGEWRPLAHENVVRVYDNREDLNLHVEFCSNGTVRDYLKARGSKSIDRGRIISDALVGLVYLHSQDPPVVHGSLNAGKIFVDEHGRAKVGEFSLAALCYPIAPFVPSVMLAGFSRWMSPELLDIDPDIDDPVLPTIASDTWALGCTIFEIVTEQLPYQKHTHDVSIQQAIINGEKPDLRGSGFEKQYGGEFCSTIESCWSKHPFERPRVSQIHAQLLLAPERLPEWYDISATQATPTQSHTPRLAPMIPLELSSETHGRRSYLGRVVSSPGTSAVELGPFRAVMDNLVQCLNIYDDYLSARNDYAELRADLEGLSCAIHTHFSASIPPAMTLSITSLCSEIQKDLNTICRKDERGVSRRIFEGARDLDEVAACYRRIAGHLQRLTLNADLSTWRIVDKIATEDLIMSLMPSTAAYYHSAQAEIVRRRECTPKTREQVLADLGRWKHSETQNNMYWVNGMAGTGKTTIANSLCTMLDQSYGLGASFFCTRHLPQCRDVNFILPTIAYQLARFSRPFYCALSRMLEQDPEVHMRALPKQLEGLIISPLREVAHTLPTNLAVVIDALDECSDSAGVGQLLGMLAKHATQLPIKIFVFSRPEPHIRQNIGNMEAQLVLHELEKSIVKEDIKTYLQVELERISPSQASLDALVERAGVLFIYAATVVRYIGAEDFSLNPKRRLEAVIGVPTSGPSNRNQDIDELYALVLASALDRPELEDSDREQIKLVLHTVICTLEPTTVNTLASLLQMDEAEQVHSALRPLWSVLRVSEGDCLVNTLHASFPEYMLDLDRSKEYGCNGREHHSRLSELCFQRIANNKRQFNICKLESSHLFDTQVPDREDRVRQEIPSDLYYACRYWAVHLNLGDWSNTHLNRLREFLTNGLLLWMEVLNLTDNISAAAPLLEQTFAQCAMADCPQDLKDLVHDAWRFAAMFASNSVSRSTPHIYVSMLASWPSSRPLSACYLPRTHGLVRFSGTGMARRLHMLLSSYTARAYIHTIAFSPDNTRIASGTSKGSVCVWDVQIGRMILGPLQHHKFKEGVSSITFSPDGTRIASGSWDETVCVFDARSGELVLEPLQHIGHVLSVAFSPDSTRVVSGTTNCTVSVWDAKSGDLIMGPLRAHSDWVNSVRFSPDGALVASGSCDKTVLIWDAKSGKKQQGPFEGHTGRVESIAFSPDGTRLASGSADRSICIWDVYSGQRALGPLLRHSSDVQSIAFSPDGRLIVSGSVDCTISVSDTESGEAVLGPFAGHTSGVSWVTFSPDGTRLASSSYDGTIRIWDVQDMREMSSLIEDYSGLIRSVAVSPDGAHIACSAHDTILIWDAKAGNLALEPLRGHTDRVLSIAFSPNGLYIVSGSSDRTVRLWDTRSGEQLLRPFQVHPDTVWSVSFSPDGTHIASASDNSVRVWDVESGALILGPLEADHGLVMSVAFSPNGALIASGGSGSSTILWGSQDGQRVLNLLGGHSEPVNSVAFSSDGTRIASGSSDNAIVVWDTHSGQIVLGPLVEHTDRINSVVFSPDGTYIASGSNDNTVIVWDAQSGGMICGPLRGHLDWVTSVAFSPDSTHLVSGSDDHVIRTWWLPGGSPHLNNTSSLAPPPSSDPPLFPPIESLDLSASVPWVLGKHGWVFDQDEHPVLWIPPDLRAGLVVPHNTLVISPRGSVILDFANCNIGERWIGCYSST